MNKIIPVLRTFSTTIQQAFRHSFTFRTDGLHTNSFQQYTDLGRSETCLQQ